MGDSVYIPAYQSLGSLLSEGYKAGYDIKEGERKKALNQSFSESLNPDGSFNTEAFLSKASSAGIGPEAVTAWLGQKTAKSDTAAKEAMNATLLEASGRKPDVLRDWFEQEKQKKVEAQKEQEARIESGRINNLPGADQFLNPSAGNSDFSYTQPTTTQEQTITPESEQTLELGSSSLAEGKLTDPGYYGAGNVDVKLPEEQKRYDVVEEALRRKEGGTTAFGTASSSTPSSFSSDLTKWEPQDDGSNEFRNYKTTLDSQLKANGLGTASEYLQKIGEATYKQNLYTPNPLAMLGKDGKPDLAAFGAENAKYEQSKLVAQGKAEEAILKARQDLIEGAKKFGVDTIASKEEKRAVEKQEAEMQGRRPEGYQFRYVTPAEATKGRDLVASYFDIRDGEKRGGFEGSYAAALAKAKADGSVNSDAIIGNLVAMGAVPSEKAIAIKSLMSPEGSISAPIMKSIASTVLKGVVTDKAKQASWFSDAKNNISETAQMFGYKIGEKTTPTPVKKEDKVGEDLKAKVEKGKAARAKVGVSKKGRSL